MMGVYIPGMEMPTGNPEEPTAVWLYPDGSVKAFYNCGNLIIDTYAIHVPKHGRLIDADALLRDRESAFVDRDGYPEFSYMAVTEAPTIIQAEEGEA